MRIAPKPVSAYPRYLKPFFRNQRRKYGAVLDPALLWGRAPLGYAQAVTITDRGVDDLLMARMRRHFDDDTVVELTGLVAFQNLSSKFNSALAVPPQGFCRLPDGANKQGPAK